MNELESELNSLRGGGQASGPDLAVELQRIYDSEINLRIGWFWDGGIEVRLGDEMNGYEAAEFFQSAAEILPWLRDAIAHFYPKSEYAASLDADTLERARTRLFQTPSVGARAVCPHCGTPHASMMDELFAFVCTHCGTSVTVDPPKVQ